jgi:hypothetical protein
MTDFSDDSQSDSDRLGGPVGLRFAGSSNISRNTLLQIARHLHLGGFGSLASHISEWFGHRMSLLPRLTI